MSPSMLKIISQEKNDQKIIHHRFKKNTMKKITCALFIALIASFHCYSQFKLSPADSIRRDSINRVTQQDYNSMLAQLHITSTRPGPSGNPSALNAANTDESKASPYTTLPDPL